MAKNTVLAKVTVGWQSLLVECSIETLQALQQARQIETCWIDDKSVSYFSESSPAIELFTGELPMPNAEAQRLIAEDASKRAAKNETETT